MGLFGQGGGGNEEPKRSQEDWDELMRATNMLPGVKDRAAQHAPSVGLPSKGLQSIGLTPASAAMKQNAGRRLAPI